MEAPQWIILSLVLILLILIMIRIRAGWAERYTDGYDTGMSMTIGSREVQEDCYVLRQREEGLLAVVADGMGKQYGGKVAANIAVETFQQLFDSWQPFENPNYYFKKAFFSANRRILNAVEESRGSASVAAILIQDHKMYYATVGNVKIGICRNRDLVPVTSGHTIDILAREQYHQGKLTREDAIALLEEHRLYNYVGQDGFREIEYFDEPVTLKKNDQVVLMSDGIYDTISWKEIEQTLEQKQSSQQKAFWLTEKVNQDNRADKDNASVIILERK